MNYSLSFLPEVEDDVLNGYTWYEQKSIELGEESPVCFTHALRRYQGTPFFIKQYTKISGAVYSDDSLTQFTLK